MTWPVVQSVKGLGLHPSWNACTDDEVATHSCNLSIQYRCLHTSASRVVEYNCIEEVVKPNRCLVSDIHLHAVGFQWHLSCDTVVSHVWMTKLGVVVQVTSYKGSENCTEFLWMAWKHKIISSVCVSQVRLNFTFYLFILSSYGRASFQTLVMHALRSVEASLSRRVVRCRFFSFRRWEAARDEAAGICNPCLQLHNSVHFKYKLENICTILSTHEKRVLPNIRLCVLVVGLAATALFQSVFSLEGSLLAGGIGWVCRFACSVLHNLLMAVGHLLFLIIWPKVHKLYCAIGRGDKWLLQNQGNTLKCRKDIYVYILIECSKSNHSLPVGAEGIWLSLSLGNNMIASLL